MLRMDMALEREYAFDIFSNLMVSTGSGAPTPHPAFGNTRPGCPWRRASRILFAGEAGEGRRAGLLHSLWEPNERIPDGALSSGMEEDAASSLGNCKTETDPLGLAQVSGIL